MPFVPAVNVAGVEMRYTLDGENVENTLYFLFETAIDVAELFTLGGILATWWGANLQPLLTTGMELQSIHLADLTTDSSAAIDFTGGLPLGGTIAEEPPPNNVAACISFRTAFRGRARRGRNYICGFSNSAVFSSTLNSEWMADVVDAYEALNPAVSDEGFSHVVISRFSGSTIVDGIKVPTPRVTALITPVTNYLFTDATSDSMKNRLPNH